MNVRWRYIDINSYKLHEFPKFSYNPTRINQNPTKPWSVSNPYVNKVFYKLSAGIYSGFINLPFQIIFIAIGFLEQLKCTLGTVDEMPSSPSIPACHGLCRDGLIFYL